MEKRKTLTYLSSQCTLADHVRVFNNTSEPMYGESISAIMINLETIAMTKERSLNIAIPPFHVSYSPLDLQ